jgi:hypothetical protein
VNGDGNPVVFVAHCCGQTDVTYFQSNGDGTFQAEQQLASGSSPMAIAATKSGALTTIFSADNGGAVTSVSLVSQCTWPSSPALSLGVEPQHAVSACPPPRLR